MNFPGRIIGGTLVAIAVAWILNIAGVFPFNSRSNNQISDAQGASDSSLATNGQQNRTGTQSYGTGTQGNGTIAQQPLNTTNPPNPNPSPNSVSQAPVQETPVVRAGW